MKRCERCLYPTTKVDLWFNDDGVCSACLAYDKRAETDWGAREKELLKILETAPKNDSGYDCIVPSSGGKDSHWQVLKLIDLGVRPLVVTATTCHLTDIGRKNIDNLARYATTVEISPNKQVRAALNRAGLELVGDPSWPEHVAIFTTPFRAAVDFGIPLIFYGECPQNQYGGPPGTGDAREMTRRWISEFGGLLGLRAADMVGYDGITADDMRDYCLPEADDVECFGLRAYFLGQFYPWDSWRNAEVARSHGMIWDLPSQANWWEFENLDNAQTGMHDHLMFLKYHYGRATAQLSVDIRAGRINRDEALDIARLKDGTFPWSYAGVPIEDVLDRMGITMGKLQDAMRKARSERIAA